MTKLRIEYLEDRLMGSVDRDIEVDLRKAIEDIRKKPGLFKRCLDYYFEPKAIEKWNDSAIYRWLGVGYFQKAFDKYVIPKDYKRYTTPWTVGKPSKKSLEKFKGYSKFNEFTHTIGAVCCGISAYNCFNEEIWNLGIIWSLSSLANISLSLLQRYNRVRVQNVLDKRYGEEETNE